MEPLTGIQAAVTVMNGFEKLRKLYKDWAGQLPEGSIKDQASRTLTSTDETLQLTKIELAKGFDYNLCRRHFPPGILLDIREDACGRWKCDTCGDITPHNVPQGKATSA